jgi:pimeloyl-ACP methyl ester carboxylesterase
MHIITSPTGTTAQPHSARRRKGLGFWTGRVLLGLVITLVALAASGAIYQAVATAIDQRTYPPPGQLVDVGGYRLHIQCAGTGSPTVILDAAADMMSADWGWIQPAVAQHTRVCAYDRAGMGWSDPGPLPRDAQHISAELHTLLTKAKLTGPYVLVGHSAGGLYVRMYAAQYPDDVVGMVLVDPGHPDMNTRIPALQAKNAEDARLVSTLSILSYFGVPRLLGIGNANTQGLPAQQRAEASAATVTPQHWATVGALIEATPATYDEVRGTGGLGDRPLIVISTTTAWLTAGAPADDARRILNDLHTELGALSSESRHDLVAGATHGSLVHNREHAQATIDAILQVVEAARTGLPLAP